MLQKQHHHSDIFISCARIQNRYVIGRHTPQKSIEIAKLQYFLSMPKMIAGFNALIAWVIAIVRIAWSVLAHHQAQSNISMILFFYYLSFVHFGHPILWSTTVFPLFFVIIFYWTPRLSRAFEHIYVFIPSKQQFDRASSGERVYCGTQEPKSDAIMQQWHTHIVHMHIGHNETAHCQKHSTVISQ